MPQSKLPFSEKFTDKYSPLRIEDFVGLPKPKAIMLGFLKRPRPDEFLFLGPSGRGKTQMALVLCKQMGATLHHIPSQDANLENIDYVTRICHYVPFNFKTGEAAAFNMVLVDEAHLATSAAQRALLSKLDATAHPPNTIFIFTANTTNGMEPPFLSRLKTIRFDEERFDVELPKLLSRIAKKEGLTARLDYREIAMSTNYNVRDALQKLELEIMGAKYLQDGSAKRK